MPKHNQVLSPSMFSWMLVLHRAEYAKDAHASATMFSTKASYISECSYAGNVMLKAKET